MNENVKDKGSVRRERNEKDSIAFCECRILCQALEVTPQDELIMVLESRKSYLFHCVVLILNNSERNSKDFLSVFHQLNLRVVTPNPYHIPTSKQDMGTVVLGKLESGSICKGQQLVMMPNKLVVQMFLHSVQPHQWNHSSKERRGQWPPGLPLPPCRLKPEICCSQFALWNRVLSLSEVTCTFSVTPYHNQELLLPPDLRCEHGAVPAPVPTAPTPDPLPIRACSQPPAPLAPYAI
ncbi:Eukaryotic peptide chain release factor GTP-binding subunit ERF3A [Manis javanica]|nr:Eukaryotic peptide chain release factor GTP-binding subunit ERF3A [Manis javanica]